MLIRMRRAHGTGRAAGNAEVEGSADRDARGKELRAFFFLTVVLAPLTSVVVVGGYGFLIWIYQLLAGPPAS